VRSLVLKLGLVALLVFSVFLLDLPVVSAGVMMMNWESPTAYLLSSVFMISSSDGWAVGYGTIIHWNGTNWSNVTSPTRRLLSSVFMVGGNDGWAVGEVGTILRWTGTAWVSEFPVFLTLPLFFIATLITFKICRRLKRTKTGTSRIQRLL